MALIDEPKLQGNVESILDLLRKDTNCCKVVSATWANSSLIAQGVFVTVTQKGDVIVYDVPGGTVLTASQYGVLTKP